METGVHFPCYDFPSADRAMTHFYAAMAEHEGRRISERIRDGLAAKKARGEAVGNPAVCNRSMGREPVRRTSSLSGCTPRLTATGPQE